MAEETKKKKVWFMTSAQIFPTVMILLSLASCALYACNGDVRRAVYWFAAAVLTTSVTF